MALCLSSPGLRNDGSRAFYSDDEVYDLRFGIDTKVEVEGTKIGVLGHHHQRDDFLTLDDEKFEAVLFVNYLFPFLSRGMS